MTVLPARYGPPAVFTWYDRNGNRSTVVKRPQLFRKNPNQISVRNLAHYFELRSTVAISREQASFRSTPAFLSASARSNPGGRFCASSSALSAAILHSDFIGGLRQSLVPIAIEVPNSFFSSDLGQHEWLEQVIAANIVAEQSDRTLTR
jgi:hypothetical protein